MAHPPHRSLTGSGPAAAPAASLRRRALLGAAAAWPLGGVLAAGAGAGAGQSAGAAPLRLVYFETYSPFSFREAGVLKGVLVDVLDEILERQLGVAVQHQGYPWVRAQSLVQSGQADGFCTTVTPARLAYVVAASEPVLVQPRRMFVRADNPLLPRLREVRNLQELRQLNPRIVTYVGNGWGQLNFAGFRVELGHDYGSALRMLVARRGDVMIDYAQSMQYSLQRLSGGGEVVMLPAPMAHTAFQLMLHKRSPHVGLLPAFDKALAQFKKGPGYAAIFQRYGVSL